MCVCVCATTINNVLRKSLEMFRPFFEDVLGNFMGAAEQQQSSSRAAAEQQQSSSRVTAEQQHSSSRIATEQQQSSIIIAAESHH